ncbi:MAG: nuclease-related domain-containing protein [Acidimicrobiales bacterium]
MGWVRKPTVWGGVCAGCGARLDHLHEAWLDGAGVVRCLACGPDEGPTPTGVAAPLHPGVAAQAARTRRRGATTRLEASAHPIDRALAELLGEGSHVLTDRTTKDGRPLDHVVVARSGVWVVESREWTGRVEYRLTPTSNGRPRLLVGAVDRTAEAEAVATVAEVIGALLGEDVPVEPALAITLGDWNLASLPNLVLSRPLRHGTVWIGPPRLVVARINASGPLDVSTVERLSAVLEEGLGRR